ncbi:hypothetical protein IC614_06425 [Allosphingosinicella flava]|uniref:Uncharacterized protein n=1 Tax=Allosphingosinicella flava TaxID=2771430 RepID=A0A7T2GHM0_9SPHN|nr:hypothetical protein [Sphingosinicella flava]QPQ54013.1 hypothetical protein IC614_06425 [Sphingosinicella flava]
MRHIASIAAAACLAAASTPASAQVEHRWAVAIGGINMHCNAWDGAAVLIEIDPSINDVGLASRLFNGQPLIELNPNVLAQFSPRVQQWWFAHECAHHALHPSQNSETAADCFGIRRMAAFGILRHPSELQAFAWDLRNLPGTPTGHLPGPVRAQNIALCALM